ncbi:MAG TPA: carboxypeptidase-like regulatory domain-containing protein [Pyrinomonadaceae bacterium]|nr:carboxypeptidase-like regulatory domain-containing protein [Pyrinomonadaceae bacterium]
MREDEIEALIRDREGRLCIRLYRRPDGTLITKDCPVGRSAVRKRIAKFAGACVAAIFGLLSFSFGQESSKRSKPAATSVERSHKEKQESQLSGIVADPNGAVVPGAMIRLFREGETKGSKPLVSTRTNEDGSYVFSGLTEGNYYVEASIPGFKKKIVKNVRLNGSKVAVLNIALEVSELIEIVGIFLDEPMIDLRSPSLTTVIPIRPHH